MERSGLQESEIDFYHEHGYLIVRSVFSGCEIQSLSQEVDRLIAERTHTFLPGNMRVRFKASGEKQVIEVIDPVSDLSEIARSVCFDTRLTDRVASLYGEPACLFKDKYFCKPPGTEGLGLHQDWISWPGFPESFLTVLISVDPFHGSSGATMVYPGCHKRGYLAERDGMHHHLEHSKMGVQPVCLELEPGDIALFSCFTPHYSETNRSESCRRGYFISYNALSDGGEQWESHYREFHDWIRSRVPQESREKLVFV